MIRTEARDVYMRVHVCVRESVAPRQGRTPAAERRSLGFVFHRYLFYVLLYNFFLHVLQIMDLLINLNNNISITYQFQTWTFILHMFHFLTKKVLLIFLWSPTHHCLVFDSSSGCTANESGHVLGILSLHGGSAVQDRKSYSDQLYTVCDGEGN